MPLRAEDDHEGSEHVKRHEKRSVDCELTRTTRTDDRGVGANLNDCAARDRTRNDDNLLCGAGNSGSQRGEGSHGGGRATNATSGTRSVADGRAVCAASTLLKRVGLQKE